MNIVADERNKRVGSLEIEIAALHSDLKKVHGALKAEKQSSSRLNKEMVQLHAQELAHLRAEVQEAKDKVARADQEASEAKICLAEAETKGHELKGENDRLQARIFDLKTKQKEDCERTKKMEARIDAAERLERTARQESARLHQEIGRLGDECGAAEGHAAEANHRSERLNKRALAAEKRADAAQKAEQESGLDLDKASKAASELAIALANEKRKTAKAEKALAAADAAILSLRQQTAQQSAELQALKDENDSTKVDLQEAYHRGVQDSERIAELEAHIDHQENLADALQECEQQKDNYQTQIKNLQKKILGLHHLQEEYSAQETLVSQLHEDSSQKDKLIEEYKVILNRQYRQIETLQKAAKNQNQTIQDRDDQLKDLRNEAAAAIKDEKAAAERAYQSRVAEHEAAINVLKTGGREVTARAEFAEQQASQLAIRVQELEHEKAAGQIGLNNNNHHNNHRNNNHNINIDNNNPNHNGNSNNDPSGTRPRLSARMTINSKDEVVFSCER